MDKVLITGLTGKSGSAFAELLRGYTYSHRRDTLVAPVGGGGGQK